MDHADRHEGAGQARELVAEAAGRIDAVIAAAYPDISRARVQRLIASGAVLLNGEPARKSGQVVPGDRVSLEVPANEHVPAPVGFDLPVLYEDDQLMAIDKPAGLAVHGAPGDTGPAVAGWMLQRLGKQADAFEAERPGIVHRLDKDTSGVLLLAKTPAAQKKLSAAFEAREAKKTYLAVCEGQPTRARAVVDAPIGRHPGDRTRMAVAKQGRDARTEYELLASDGERSFLLVRPETGRTHQIRVHLAAIGHAVTFDRVYGSGGAGRQLLHAWQLDVPHPGGRGVLRLTAPMPRDLRDAVRALGAETVALPYCEPVPSGLLAEEP